MRAYDNKDYRYKTSEGESEAALRFVKQVLGFHPDVSTLEYDLNFFAGGIGVYDRVAFSCGIQSQQWPDLVKKLNLVTPSDALGFSDWREEFLWLVNSEEPTTSIDVYSADFINSKKRDFQALCISSGQIFFSKDSDVNSWTAVWENDGTINYLGFEQG
ncbi:hypothetical protein ABT364_08745 [Massilia sp. SR12]